MPPYLPFFGWSGAFIKIGLIDVDSHNFPNLALMKLAAHHRARGDRVEWWNGLTHYDMVYKSKVFTDMYSKDQNHIIHADKVICGGTGYGLDNKLPDPVEHICPDNSIYPQFQGTAYGFLTRGCPRACGFCFVSRKEGRKSVQVAAPDEFWRGERYIKLLDPNILACSEHEKLLCSLVKCGAWVDFTQGLDIRLITADNVKLLDSLKIERIRFAWDDPGEDLTVAFQRYAELTGKKRRKRSVYVLTNYGSTHEQDLYCVYALRDMGFDPYIMIYGKLAAPELTRKLQRWVNNKRIFGCAKDFKDYDERLRKQNGN